MEMCVIRAVRIYPYPTLTYSAVQLLKRLCLLYLLSKDSGQTDLHECLFQFFSSFSSQSHVNKLLIQKVGLYPYVVAVGREHISYLTQLQAFVPTIEELSTCMDDEKLSEVLPYISNCANIIMDFLASPLRDA